MILRGLLEETTEVVSSDLRGLTNHCKTYGAWGLEAFKAEEILCLDKGTSTLGPVTIFVLDDVVLRNRLGPGGITFESNMVNARNGIDAVWRGRARGE